MAKGLTEPLIARFTEAVQLLTDDKDKSCSLVRTARDRTKQYGPAE